MQIKLAILDDGGVLRGYEVVEHDHVEGEEILSESPADGFCAQKPASFEVPARRVMVPIGCDLVPDKASWDGTKFVPLGRPILGDDAPTEAPNVIMAIARGFQAIRDSGTVKLPQATLEWLSWWERTIDAR